MSWQPAVIAGYDIRTNVRIWSTNMIMMTSWIVEIDMYTVKLAL